MQEQTEPQSNREPTNKKSPRHQFGNAVKSGRAWLTALSQNSHLIKKSSTPETLQIIEEAPIKNSTTTIDLPNDAPKKTAEKLLKIQTHEVIDRLYGLPRIEDLPQAAQIIAKDDVALVNKDLEEAYRITDDTSSPSFQYQAAKFLESANLYSTVPIRGRLKEHLTFGIGKVFSTSSPTQIEMKEDEVWITEDLINATRTLRVWASQIARALRDKTELSGLRSVADRVIKESCYEDVTIESIENKNEAFSKIGKEDLLFYHGTYTDAFLDMLETKGLSSRKKQIEIRSKARFSTAEGKRQNQEMEQVAFSVNEPNWGYTRQPPENGDTHFLGPPEDIWVITDGGWLLKNQGSNFFYTDGIHLFNSNIDEGFELSFTDNPSCFMMTQERYNIIKQRLTTDKRFSPETLSFFESKAIIIPSESIPRAKTQWELDQIIQQKIKEKIVSSSLPYDLQPDSGFFAPSGKLGQDQSGRETMTYCWVSNSSIPHIDDTRQQLRRTTQGAELWNRFIPDEKKMYQALIDRRVNFLKTVKESRQPEKILYIGCGFDRLPAEVFGKDKVTNVSLEDYYFAAHQGMKNIQADIANLSSVNGSYDIVYTHGMDPDLIQKNLSQLLEKLDSNGALVFDYDGWYPEYLSDKIIPTMNAISKSLPPVILDDQFADVMDIEESKRIQEAVLAKGISKYGSPVPYVQQCFRVFARK